MIDCGGLQMDYYDAKHFCDGLNATLVYVDSQAENDDIVEMALLNDSESTEPNRNGRCEGKAFSKSVSFFVCVDTHRSGEQVLVLDIGFFFGYRLVLGTVGSVDGLLGLVD